jgi:hypothetical protein
MGILNVQVDPLTAAITNPNRLQLAQLVQQLLNTHGVGRDQVCKRRAPPSPPLSRELAWLV